MEMRLELVQFGVSGLTDIRTLCTRWQAVLDLLTQETSPAPDFRAYRQVGLTAAIIGYASRYGRYGYRRILALLQSDGWVVNHKRRERIWRQEGLKVPQKQPKRGRLWLTDGSYVRLRPCWPNHVWSYDFVMERTHDGKAFRMLTIIDEVHAGMPGHRGGPAFGC